MLRTHPFGDPQQFGVFEHVRPVTRRDEKVAGVEDLLRLVHALHAGLAGVDVSSVRDRARGARKDRDETVGLLARALAWVRIP
jgi:hypothetical protein